MNSHFNVFFKQKEAAGNKEAPKKKTECLSYGRLWMFHNRPQTPHPELLRKIRKGCFTISYTTGKQSIAPACDSKIKRLKTPTLSSRQIQNLTCFCSCLFLCFGQRCETSYQQPVSAGQSLVITPTVALRDVSLFKQSYISKTYTHCTFLKDLTKNGTYQGLDIFMGVFLSRLNRVAYFLFLLLLPKKILEDLNYVCVESFIHLRCVQSRKSSSFAPGELIP